MSDDTIDREMRDLAETLARTAPGLDFTLASLKALEKLARKKPPSPAHTRACGAYLGETMRRQAPEQLRWVSFASAAKANATIGKLPPGPDFDALLAAAETFWFPLSKVEKFQKNGSTDSLGPFANVALRAVVGPTPADDEAERERRAEAGSVVDAAMRAFRKEESVRDPVFDDVPAAPSRGAGALVVVAGGLGSVLLGLVAIDAGRYGRFAEEAAYWTVGRSRMASYPTAPVALVLVLAALGASAALAHRRRAEAATLAPALVTGLLAFLGGLVHVVMRLRCDVTAGAAPNALYIYLPLGVGATVVPAALALAAASAFRAPSSRLALPLLALPLLMAGLAIVAVASEHSRSASQRASARVELVDRLREEEAHVCLAVVPCLLLLPWIRARPSAALGSLAWAVLAAGLFAVTRPLAIDAGSAPPRVADDGRTCGPLAGGPLFSLDTFALDGRAMRTPEELGRDLGTMSQNWAILHPRSEAPGVLSLTWHGPGSITFTVVRPYLATALAHGYHRLAVRFDRPCTWRTYTRGVLTRPMQCDRIVQLDAALPTDAPDLVSLFSSAGPEHLAVGPIE